MMENQKQGPVRLEIKFVAAKIHLTEVLNWVKHNPANFRTAFPPRTVNNLYFDGPTLGAYTENLSGASNRTKIRFRWYGDISLPTQGVFEVKRKRNLFGWKHQYPISGVLFDEGAPWSRFRESIRKQLPGEARAWLVGNLQAVLVNRYRRQYFESADRLTRVTVDTDQKVWSQVEKKRPNFKFETPLPKTVVMEFKFPREAAKTVSDVVNGIPWRPTRHSKYVTGLVYGLAN